MLVINKKDDKWLCNLILTYYDGVEKYITTESGNLLPLFQDKSFNNHLRFIGQKIYDLLWMTDQIKGMRIIVVHNNMWIDRYLNKNIIYHYYISQKCQNFPNYIMSETSDQIEIINTIVQQICGSVITRNEHFPDIDINDILNKTIHSALLRGVPHRFLTGVLGIFDPISFTLPERLPPINNTLAVATGGKIRKGSYESMTKVELIKRAEKRKLPCKKYMSKAEIIRLLRK